MTTIKTIEEDRQDYNAALSSLPSISVSSLTPSETIQYIAFMMEEIHRLRLEVWQLRNIAKPEETINK